MATPGRNELRCTTCGRPVSLPDVVRAVEVLEQRDSRGNVVASFDGYEALFHPGCWDDLRTKRVYSRRVFRRRPARAIDSA